MKTDKGRLIIEFFSGIKSSNFAHAYYDTDLRIVKAMKKTLTFWYSAIFSLAIVQIVGALFDYFTGNYNLSSWKLQYEML